jgi:hypothetical protein
MVCGVRSRSLRQADHSSRGVPPSFVFLSACDLEALTVRPRLTRAVEPWEGGGGGFCEGTDFRHLNRCLN